MKNVPLALLALILFARSGDAQASTEEHVAESPKKDPALDPRGLEIMLRPAVSGAGSDSPILLAGPLGRAAGTTMGELLAGAEPYGPGLMGHAFVGYRFNSLMSFGLRGGFRQSSVVRMNDGTTDLSRSAWDVGLAFRVYPLARVASVQKIFEPWASIGTSYMQDVQTFDRPWTASDGNDVLAHWKLDHHSLATHLGVGFDFRVHPRLAIGPSFDATLAQPITGCLKISADGYIPSSLCSTSSPGDQLLEAHAYLVWSAGIDLKITLF